MRQFNVIASVLFAATLATPAFAANGFTPSDTDSGGSYHAMPSVKTRAEVLSELQRAREDGSLAKMSRNFSYAPDYASTASNAPSRELVLSELQRAREDGSLAKMSRNFSYAPDYASTASNAPSRERVLSELQHAREDGSLQCLNSNRARNC